MASKTHMRPNYTAAGKATRGPDSSTSKAKMPLKPTPCHQLPNNATSSSKIAENIPTANHATSSSKAAEDVPTTIAMTSLNHTPSPSTNHTVISISSYAAVIINDPSLTEAMQEDVSCQANGKLNQDVSRTTSMPSSSSPNLLPPGRPPKLDDDMSPESETLIVPNSQATDNQMDYMPDPSRAMDIPPVNTQDS
ncbi:hypothetical protein K2173_009702 [Erythroxylum novogranatense]|uniref:Uncharacterized protein n=1 Tax=Erythroxylum novogranatense TaxID=1862640 RepID=A0AAV8U5V3_9ROSI|nr:hypothetical protein K2173_009702 [Erythroxylum novogranatense]